MARGAELNPASKLVGDDVALGSGAQPSEAILVDEGEGLGSRALPSQAILVDEHGGLGSRARPSQAVLVVDDGGLGSRAQPSRAMVVDKRDVQRSEAQLWQDSCTAEPRGSRVAQPRRVGGGT